MVLGCWGPVLATPSHCLHVTENVVAEILRPPQARLLALGLRIGRLRRTTLSDLEEIVAYANLKVRLGDGEAATLAAAVSVGTTTSACFIARTTYPSPNLRPRGRGREREGKEPVGSEGRLVR